MRLSFSDSDLASALRLAKKLLPLMGRKAKNPVIAFFALKILIIDLETDLGLSMTLEDEIKLRSYLKALDVWVKSSGLGSDKNLK